MLYCSSHLAMLIAGGVILIAFVQAKLGESLSLERLIGEQLVFLVVLLPSAGTLFFGGINI